MSWGSAISSAVVMTGPKGAQRSWPLWRKVVRRFGMPRAETSMKFA